MLTRVWEYAAAVIGYWQFWVAVAFMIERATERYFPSFWKWSEQYVTLEHRRKLFVGIAILAFLYANFRAFDAEREAKERALAAPAIRIALDPMALYQGGIPVGLVTSPKIDPANSLIGFPIVTASRRLEMDKEFQFRDWRLLCSGQEGGSMSFGAMSQINYGNFVCKIQGPR